MFMMSPSSYDIIEHVASTHLPIEVIESFNEVLSGFPNGRLYTHIAFCPNMYSCIVLWTQEGMSPLLMLNFNATFHVVHRA